MNDLQSVLTVGPSNAELIAGLILRMRSVGKTIRMQVVEPVASRCRFDRRRSTLSGSDGRMLVDIGVEPGEVKHGFREGHWLYDEQR